VESEITHLDTGLEVSSFELGRPSATSSCATSSLICLMFLYERSKVRPLSVDFCWASAMWSEERETTGMGLAGLGRVDRGEDLV